MGLMRDVAHWLGGYKLEKCFWFGTQHYATWLRSPSRGSSFSPEAWGDAGTYLSGGGWAANSAGSHREFILQWGEAASIEDAMLMQAFRDGAYSESPYDLMYFYDPLSYDRNVLPKQWAQPSLLGPLLGLEVGATPASLGGGLPRRTLVVPAGYQEGLDPVGPGRGVLYQPIPDGYELFLCGMGADVFRVKPQNVDGDFGSSLSVPGVGWRGVHEARGVLIYLENQDSESALAAGLRAVLQPVGGHEPESPFSGVPEWLPGMGHSGCRFVGQPTYVPTGPYSGGLASFAVTLKEVGDWL